MLFEACRASLIQVNETIFPTGTQPQGIEALVGLFRTVRDFITHNLVLGANATMAYIRSQHPQLVFCSPEAGSVLSQQNMDGTFDSVRRIVER